MRPSRIPNSPPTARASSGEKKSGSVIAVAARRGDALARALDIDLWRSGEVFRDGDWASSVAEAEIFGRFRMEYLVRKVRFLGKGLRPSAAVAAAIAYWRWFCGMGY